VRVRYNVYKYLVTGSLGPNVPKAGRDKTTMETHGFLRFVHVPNHSSSACKHSSSLVRLFLDTSK
jgi:hypothetical protein